MKTISCKCELTEFGRRDNVNQYESMFDDTDSAVTDRICLFVKKYDSEGNLQNYQFSEIITTEYAGILFVIDKKEMPNLNDYKIDFRDGFPKLTKKGD